MNRLVPTVRLRRRLIALAWLLALLLVLATPLRRLLDHDVLIALLRPLGWSAPLLFAVAYAVALVIGLPTVVFTVAGGAVFGLLPGTLWSLTGATGGALGAFCLSRYLLRSWAEHRFRAHPALARFRAGIARRGLLFVLLVRTVPVTPFNLENYLFGLTSIDVRTYVLGTVIGITPGTIAYTWLGVTGERALQGGDLTHVFFALAVLLLLAMVPPLLYRRGNPR